MLGGKCSDPHKLTFSADGVSSLLGGGAETTAPSAPDGCAELSRLSSIGSLVCCSVSGLASHWDLETIIRKGEL